MQFDNPAARLLKILKEGRPINSNQSCRDVWHGLLQVNKSDSALLMSRLGKLMELPQIIIREIQDNYPNQVSTHEHWSQKVNTAFMQQNLNGKWSEFMQHIDSHTLNYLSMSADLLDMKAETQVIPEDKLSEIKSKVNELLAEALESEIDPDFKRYIVRYLYKITVAIDEYHISGVQPISESIESAFGHAVLDESYKENLSNTEFGSKVVTVLGFLASAVTVAVGLPQLPESFHYLLSSGK